MQRLASLTCAAVTALLLFAASAEAQWTRTTSPQNQLRFRLGLFEPTGDSDGWDGVFEGFTGSPSDLQDMVWGMDFVWFFGPNTGVLFGSSFFSGDTTSAYEDWQSFDGRDIRHTTRLEFADLTASFVVRFSDGRFRPYLGLGGGIVWYELTDEGEFIDFGDPDLPVFWAWYGADGTAFTAHGLAGVDVAMSPHTSFFIEGRYRWAEDTLGDDYSGFGDLDLSGWEVSGGFAFAF
ncbi:MAG: outer membrane beta-barrel protein [Thermoanaerobaculales bacterium]|jgi:hypothetical protein|nr:outer membrane beta-barrel protein [Thermoanaerobaculales bacterium]